jgi:hypothetical protein
MGGACSTHKDARNAHKISVGKPEGKRPLRRLSRKWEENIKMNLKEMGWEGVDTEAHKKHALLTSALVGDERSNSCSGYFTLMKESTARLG